MTGETITSTQNPFMLRLKGLNDKKHRDEEGLLLAEGPKLVSEALKEGLTPAAGLYIPEKTDPALLEGLRDIPMRACTEGVLKSVTDTRTPQGIVCAFSFPAPLDAGARPRLLVAMDGVQDPGNVGGIWRTADAAGFGGVLFSRECADAMSPKVIRAAMGSAFRVPALRCADLAEELVRLRAQGYAVLVTALDGEDFFSGMPGRDTPCVLVIGSEGHGISDAVRSTATKALRLPMAGGAESLNANTAAGIMLYSLAYSLRPQYTE